MNATAIRNLNKDNPAVNLAPELLWTIFKLNVNMFMDAIVLDNLRLSSQVCRDWSSIIVGSPSLWAQAIDLDSLLPNIFDSISDYESELEPENEGEEDGARL